MTSIMQGRKPRPEATPEMAVLPVDLPLGRATGVYGRRLLVLLSVAALLLVVALIASFVGPLGSLSIGFVVAALAAGLPASMSSRVGLLGEGKERARRFLFGLLLWTLPSIVALSAFLAAGDNRDWTLQFTTLAVAGSTVLTFLGSALIARWRVAKEAWMKETQATVSFARATQPMTIVLGRVAAAESEQERDDAVRVLINTAVGLTKTMSGRSGQQRSRTRSSFYEFAAPGELLLRKFEGDYGDPRQLFNAGLSENDRRVVELARSETVLFVNDLDAASPSYFSNPTGRSYKSLISVPVRAGDMSFGVLMIDAEFAGSLSDVDIAYAMSIAGLLGTGLAIAVPTIDVSRRANVATLLDYLEDLPATLDSAFALDPARNSASSFDLVPDDDREFLSGRMDLQRFSASVHSLAERRVTRRLNELSLQRTLPRWVRARSSTRPATWRARAERWRRR